MSDTNDRTLFLEGNLHAIQIISKDENIKSLESYMNEENKKLTGLMRSLEIYTGQEIQTLRETMVNRLQAIEYQKQRYKP